MTTYIKSLIVDYKGELIITDIDDCLIQTTKMLTNNRITNRKFWYDPDTYEANKEHVFMNAQLTRWGREFIELVKSGVIKDYIMLTAAHNRRDILTEKFGIGKLNLIEAMPIYKKIEYLEAVDVPAIYVDDIGDVIDNMYNDNVECIQV